MNLLLVLALAATPQPCVETGGLLSKRISDADPAVCMARFSGYSGGESGAANPKFWLKGLDFSCASPWNSGGGRVRAGTAISKRHVIFAKHFPLWKGVRIVFIGEDGGVCPCSIEATKSIERSDIMVGLLNAEITPNIRPAKILPPDYEKHIGDGKGLPVVTFNQRDEAHLFEVGVLPTNPAPPYVARTMPPSGMQREKLGGKIIGGDSGKPAFLIWGNQPILLFCLTNGGCGSGPAVHRYRREIQKAMDELCPGYQLETFDFSAQKRLVEK